MTQRSDSAHDALAALRRGDAVIFPTDTVYGLGVSVAHAADPQMLYRLKGRPSDKPVSWLVGAVSDLERYGCDLSAGALSLARKFWPGPLTLVVRASERVAAPFRSADGTIGLRMPDNAVALGLIDALGCPIATTSANPSGARPPRLFSEVDSGLAACAGAVLADGEDALDVSKSGVASTVLDCTGSRPVVLRQGAVTARDVEACCEYERSAFKET